MPLNYMNPTDRPPTPEELREMKMARAQYAEPVSYIEVNGNEPSKPGQVEEMLHYLNMEIGRCEKLDMALRDHLVPIVNPADPSGRPVDTEAQKVPMCILAERLCDMADALRNHNNRLDALLVRLEL